MTHIEERAEAVAREICTTPLVNGVKAETLIKDALLSFSKQKVEDVEQDCNAHAVEAANLRLRLDLLKLKSERLASALQIASNNMTDHVRYGPDNSYHMDGCAKCTVVSALNDWRRNQ